MLVAVCLGALVGVYFGTAPIVGTLTTQQLGDVGGLVIRLLKALAVPLLFLAIVDSFLRTELTARQAARLVVICLVNVSVAFAIGLTLLNVLRPGDAWRGHLEQMTGVVGASNLATPPQASLDPLRNLDGYVPKTVVEPFAQNAVISVVLLALLCGAALRRVVAARGEAEQRTVGAVVEAGYLTLMQMLIWVVHAVPYAVFGVVAQVVGRSGLGVFSVLWTFLSVIVLGLCLHAFIYYPLVAWFVGRKPPRVYLGGGADAVLAGFSMNSSLAAVPMTLRALTEKMGVSQGSARLAACVGTNLNNDGITLYEAMTALFLAQACGFDLGWLQQLVIVLASLMAGMGIAGIPEAGLIVLPLVLSAAGLPDKLIVAVIPFVLPVDWIIARVRSAVNVMSDMLVAILLDRFQGQGPSS